VDTLVAGAVDKVDILVKDTRTPIAADLLATNDGLKIIRRAAAKITGTATGGLIGIRGIA